MMFQAIESAYVAVSDLDTACRPYQRLGLRLSPAHDARQTLHVGGPRNPFSVHFLGEAGCDDPLSVALRRALAASRSLFAIGLRVSGLDSVVRDLSARGFPAMNFRHGDDLAWLPLQEQAGTDLVLVGHDRPAEADRTGLLSHSFPLRRLDHLAVVATDLEARSRFWSEGLGVPITGEVATTTLLIRQLRIGDAILELLGPASRDSPLGSGRRGWSVWRPGRCPTWTQRLPRLEPQASA
jgi:catechol 2,3-dioxygenase-like lactoylglutathione lyase family enzyme